MRIHTVQQRRAPSTISLDDSLDPSMMDTSVPAVFPPAVHRFPFNGLGAAAEMEYEQERSHRGTSGGAAVRPLPTVSERVGSYGRRSNNYDDNGIEVQLANGDLALIGNRLCREDSGISINEPHRGRFERLKNICSFATLSSGGGSDSERSNGMSRSQHWMLMITPVVSSFSLALVIAAVVGPQWLLTEEKIPVTTYHNNTHGQSTLTPITSINSVHNQQQLNIQHPHLIPATKDDLSGAFLTKYTKSSLWMLCSKYSGGTAPGQSQHQMGGDEFQCSSIDYFPTEGYSPDPNDSTNAIPYTVTHSSPFFLASNGVLIVSYGLFLVAMCSTKHKICYFVSGVLFIISGLLMLIGLIMYISILKAEIGSKLRPRSSLQAPQFSFRYGQSFLLYVFGFIITELSGILNVLIYSNVQQDEYDSAHHGDQSSSYPTYQNLSGGIQYNLHYRREWAHPGEEPGKGHQDGPPIVDYRYPYDGLDDCETSPRYYFEQEQQQQQSQLQQQREQQVDDNEVECNLHRRAYGRMTHEGLSKSLTDLLYMEPAQVKPDRSVTWSRVRANGDGERTDQGVDARTPDSNMEYTHYWSSTGKLTRSVSTYTDLVPLGEQEGSVRNRRARSRSPARSDDEMTGKVSNICGLSRHYLSRELSKEKLFNEFCKKVGPRPKPKNIYYIDGRNGDDSYRSVYVVDPSSSSLHSPGPGARNRSSSQRRRNSTADARRRLATQDQLPPSSTSNYRQRIHSDNSLDDLMHDTDGRYGRRRDPIGRARSVDYRQTLPRNFQQRHLAASEPEDETGGFGERIALERKRISASGLLLEPARANVSLEDLTSDSRWHKGGVRHSLQHPASIDINRTSTTSYCPKYLDPPPPPTYTSALSAGGQHQREDFSSASHMYRSYGDLTTQQQQQQHHHQLRRPTILSPQIFVPISQPATPPPLRPMLQQSQQQQQSHRHVHHQHHRHNGTQHQQQVTITGSRNHSLPSPVFDLDRIEQERRKSHSQLFLNSPADSSSVGQYDFVNGTAV
uniref:Voltage-dependent calcium channel gamma-5 subunit n=1 Tax=Anopheles coluzzii TaxID=1518534 RepID=A0ABM2B8V5_ANOCL